MGVYESGTALEIMRLSREYVPVKEIARRLNVSTDYISTVRRFSRKPGERFGTMGRRPSDQDGDGTDDTTGERCRCGLRLPCNNCLPTAAELATARKGHYSDDAVVGDMRRGDGARTVSWLKR